MSFNGLFVAEHPIIGMVHLLPLPGSPYFQGNIDTIYERAQSDADNLLKAGIDGLIVENFGDKPYLIGEPTPAQLAVLSAVTRDIRHASTVPLGINVQFNAWQAEIAIAYVCKAQFVRVDLTPIRRTHKMSGTNKLLKGTRAEITQGRMPPLTVVPDLNMFKDGAFS